MEREKRRKEQEKMEKYMETLFEDWIAKEPPADYEKAQGDFVQGLEDCGQKEMQDAFSDCIYTAQRAAYEAGFRAARELYR